MFDFNQPALGLAREFNLDLKRVANFASRFEDKEATLNRFRQIIDGAAQATGIPYEFFEVLLELECGYPSKASYSSKMPRLGDGSKGLPDPRYPHPSAYSAAKPGRPYYGLANVNRNKQIYIGVTQISFEFWVEVRTQAAKGGARLDLRWWETSLFWQIVAPLLYALHNKRFFPSEAILTPASLYALHQQGPGGVQSHLQRTTSLSTQSANSRVVLTAAKDALRGKVSQYY